MHRPPRSVTTGLTLLAATIGCVATAADERPCDVSVLSSMAKVRRDEHGPSDAGRDLKLFVARGEAECGQLLVSAKTPLKQVAVLAPPLAGPEGATMPLDAHLVGYVPIANPTPVGFGRPGPYPDPLLPLRPFDVEAGGSQAIWVTCWVPRDAVPGIYRGEITITPAAARKTVIPVTVRVAAVEIPVCGVLHSEFLFWKFGANDEWYGKAEWPKREPGFIDTMLRYRMPFPPPLPWASVFTKKADGTWTATWDTFDAAVESWMARGTSFFMLRRQIIPWYGATPPQEIPQRDATAAKLRLLDEHLEEKGWSSRFAFYLFDEPRLSADAATPEDTRGPDNVRAIKAIAEFMHEHCPHLRLIMVTCDPAYESVAMDFPAYVWCPHINHFNGQFQLQRQRMGEPNWMYVCMTTRASNFPDIWRIDRPGASHRAVGSWLWRYQCDGFLFWCVDYWKKNPYETPDIYGKAINGDGFLFYPDPERTRDPFPSIRAELTRDGFEDYELLAMVQNAAVGIAAKAGRNPTAKAWLEKASQVVDVEDAIPRVAEFSLDPAVYEARHRRLLELLETLHKVPVLRKLASKEGP